MSPERASKYAMLALRLANVAVSGVANKTLTRRRRRALISCWPCPGIARATIDSSVGAGITSPSYEHLNQVIYALEPVQACTP